MTFPLDLRRFYFRRRAIQNSSKLDQRDARMGRGEAPVTKSAARVLRSKARPSARYRTFHVRLGILRLVMSGLAAACTMGFEACGASHTPGCCAKA
jgi:hypothetical protein